MSGSLETGRRIRKLLCTGLLVLLLIFITVTPVAAMEEYQSEIKTVVPAEHILSGTVENGSVLVNGKKCMGDFSLGILHGQSVTLTFLVDEGSEISEVLLNGEDITSRVTGNTYTFQAMMNDLVLSVSYRQNAVNPQTGFQQHPSLRWMPLLFSVGVVLLFVGKSRLKRKGL